MEASAGFALIEIATGNVVARTAALPWRVAVIGTGVCDFDAVGQIMPDADRPTHRVVQAVMINNPPGELYAPIGESVAYNAAAGRVEVTMSYPAQPNVTPPVEVIRVAYLKAALAQIGKLTVVDAAVTDPVMKALWEYAADIRRDDPDMHAIATALNIDLNDVWTRAQAIRASRGGE